MLDCMVLNNGKLTQDQQDQYWQDGYLFPMQVVSSVQAKNWRTNLEAIEAKWLDKGLPLPLNTYKRVNAQCVMPLACEIGLNSAILDIVESVLGPDIMLYSTEFFIKEPHTTQVVTMHQDLTYWGMGEIDGLVTAWLALSDVTAQTGCMDFVKASHKNPILPHADSFDENNLLSRGQEIVVEVADKDKVAVQLSPGQLSLHHGLTIHGSGPNSGNDRRIGVAIRYLTPHIQKQAGGQDYAIPARGDCMTGSFRTYSAPNRDFAPEALKLYDEIREVQTAVMMAGAKENSNIYAKGE
jgi:phytanoyl-CoA hydroxylase